MLYLNTIIIAIGVPILLFFWLAPFSFFVDIEYLHHQDTCAEQTLQTIITLRDVKWRDQYHGTVYEELYRYEGDVKLETTIKRTSTIIYQKSDEPLTIEIEWNKKLPAGEYGAYTIVEIDAGFTKREVRLEDNQRFTVKECEI